MQFYTFSPCSLIMFLVEDFPDCFQGKSLISLIFFKEEIAILPDFPKSVFISGCVIRAAQWAIVAGSISGVQGLRG